MRSGIALGALRVLMACESKAELDDSLPPGFAQAFPALRRKHPKARFQVLDASLLS
jgi:hypothetical protein